MKNEDTIQVILLPRGYGKASKEVREYVHLLQERIDKAIEYIKEHIVATETEEVLLQILKGEDK